MTTFFSAFSGDCTNPSSIIWGIRFGGVGGSKISSKAFSYFVSFPGASTSLCMLAKDASQLDRPSNFRSLSSADEADPTSAPNAPVGVSIPRGDHLLPPDLPPLWEMALSAFFLASLAIDVASFADFFKVFTVAVNSLYSAVA